MKTIEFLCTTFKTFHRCATATLSVAFVSVTQTQTFICPQSSLLIQWWPRCPQYDDSFVTGTGIDIQTMNNNGRATDRDRHMMDECSFTSLVVCMWVCCVVAKHHGREEVGVSSCSHFEKWTWMNSIWGIWMNEWKTGRCNEFKFPTAVDGSVLIRMFQDCLRF